MKATLFVAAACVLLASSTTQAQVSAGPACVPNTLASYIALEAGGCMFEGTLYPELHLFSAGLVVDFTGADSCDPFLGRIGNNTLSWIDFLRAVECTGRSVTEYNDWLQHGSIPAECERGGTCDGSDA